MGMSGEPAGKVQGSQVDPEGQGRIKPGHDLLSGAADLLDGSSCKLVVLRIEVMARKEVKVCLWLPIGP